jgi:type IV pilus assembly protein PilA
MFKALKKKMKDQRGLTLIELLAVIVILGIIAAIAVPAIGGLIDKTKEDAKVAEAIAIINAAKLARASNATVVQWNHTGNDVGTEKYGKIGNLVENVKDNGDYIVKYSVADKQYTIIKHDANTVLNKATLTEDDLLDRSGN